MDFDMVLNTELNKDGRMPLNSTAYLNGAKKMYSYELSHSTDDITPEQGLFMTNFIKNADNNNNKYFFTFKQMQSMINSHVELIEDGVIVNCRNVPFYRVRYTKTLEGYYKEGELGGYMHKNTLLWSHEHTIPEGYVYLKFNMSVEDFLNVDPRFNLNDDYISRPFDISVKTFEHCIKNKL